MIENKENDKQRQHNKKKKLFIKYKAQNLKNFSD